MPLLETVGAVGARGFGFQNSLVNIPNTDLQVTSGLLFHVDASTSYFSATPNTWYDMSSNRRHFTKFNSPTYVSNGTASYFTNFTSGYWTGVTGFMPTGTNARTIFAFVTMPSTGASPLQHVFHYGNTTSGESFGIVRDSGGSLSTHTWAGNPSFGAGLNNSTTYMLATGRSGGTEYGWRNTSSYTTSSVGSTANSPYINIGARISGAEEFNDGRIYMVAAYDRVLSNAEITTIYNQYKSRFGLA